MSSSQPAACCFLTISLIMFVGWCCNPVILNCGWWTVPTYHRMHECTPKNTGFSPVSQVSPLKRSLFVWLGAINKPISISQSVSGPSYWPRPFDGAPCTASSIASPATWKPNGAQHADIVILRTVILGVVATRSCIRWVFVGPQVTRFPYRIWQILGVPCWALHQVAFCRHVCCWPNLTCLQTNWSRRPKDYSCRFYSDHSDFITGKKEIGPLASKKICDPEGTMINSLVATESETTWGATCLWIWVTCNPWRGARSYKRSI